MNAIKKLLDSIEFSADIYPYITILDKSAAIEALQELQDFEPLLADLSAIVLEIQDTRNKLDEIMRLLADEGLYNLTIRERCV